MREPAAAHRLGIGFGDRALIPGRERGGDPFCGAIDLRHDMREQPRANWCVPRAAWYAYATRRRPLWVPTSASGSSASAAGAASLLSSADALFLMAFFLTIATVLFSSKRPAMLYLHSKPAL